MKSQEVTESPKHASCPLVLSVRARLHPDFHPVQLHGNFTKKAMSKRPAYHDFFIRYFMCCPRRDQHGEPPPI
eukprot:scaffold143999_cov34-Prasinocladus_malaysianus.AAC.2